MYVLLDKNICMIVKNFEKDEGDELAALCYIFFAFFVC